MGEKVGRTSLAEPGREAGSGMHGSQFLCNKGTDAVCALVPGLRNVRRCLVYREPVQLLRSSSE